MPNLPAATVDNPARPDVKSTSRELFYAPSESLFGAVAAEMATLGWSVFPQSKVDRRPGSVFGECIKWSAEHDLKNRLPTQAALTLWKNHCACDNLAVVFGPASGNAFAIDIDVLDAAMVREIRDLADGILGYTPFGREGKAPKIALIYRHAEDDVARSVTRILKGDDGHMVEILGRGKLLTFHGVHHKTGRYFKWINDSPMQLGPVALPLVTSAQVDEFMAAVESRFGFQKSVASNPGADFSFSGAEDTTGCRMPTADGERRTEGRYQLTQQLAFATVRLNSRLVYDAQSSGSDAVDEVKAKLSAVTLGAFHASAVCSGSRWTPERVEREIKGNVGRTVDRVLSGALKLERPPPKIPDGAHRPLVRQGYRMRRPLTR